MKRSSALLVGLLLVGCKTGPAELSPEPAQTATTNATTTATVTAAATPTPAPTALSTGGGNKGGSDPLDGKFTIADATKDLPGKGPLVATIDTSKGKLQCKLYDDKAPNTVANFIGLATGKRTWKDPKTGEWVNKPWYDGTTFHRIIKGFMIQGGDPMGSGRGEPGYTIKDELWPGAKHDRAGLLCMANRGHDTNGGQFFITDDAAAHLDGNYTIFGECAPVETVHDIANVPVMGERPREPVTIKTVTISRDSGGDKKK